MLASLLAILGGLYPGPMAAETRFSTRYVYYDVPGETVEDIYEAMRTAGPHVGGQKAYASTMAQSSQAGTLEQKGTCRVLNYRYDIQFTIRLPRLSQQDMPADLLSRWTTFTTFLKAHEETHRSIWMRCTQHIKPQVDALRAPSCAEIDARVQAIIDQANAACQKAHASFDAAEQKRLSAHPFVKGALKRARPGRAILDETRKKPRPIRKNFN